MDDFASRWCLSFAESGHEVRVYGSVASRTPLPVLVLHTIADEGQAVWRDCLHYELPPFVLVEVAVPAWHRDMTPWPGTALTPRGEPFDGGADAYLACLLERIMPRVRRMLAFTPTWQGLVGYSLAGLFALYAHFRTDAFARIASVSGSLWYWEFDAFVRDTPVPFAPRSLYLSLGDREGHVKDEVLSTVEACTQAIVDCLVRGGSTVTYERTSGNHFYEPEARIVRAIAHLLTNNAPIGAKE